MSFLLTTLLLLRCCWSGATEAHKNRRFTRRKVKLGSATCVVSSLSSPCLWSLVPLRSIFSAEPSETGFCSRAISQPALVLYSIALPLSRGLAREFHTNFALVSGRFGGAERDLVWGRSLGRLGYYTQPVRRSQGIFASDSRPNLRVFQRWAPWGSAVQGFLLPEPRFAASSYLPGQLYFAQTALAVVGSTCSVSRTTFFGGWAFCSRIFTAQSMACMPPVG